MTDHLARALVIRAISQDQSEETVGAALAVLRGDTMIGAHDDHPAARHADGIRDEIMAVTIADMPPSSDLVAILLETLSQRLGGVSRADAWRAIGVNPNRGRGLLGRNAQAVDWPIWYTLRETALAEPKRSARR